MRVQHTLAVHAKHAQASGKTPLMLSFAPAPLPALYALV